MEKELGWAGLLLLLVLAGCTSSSPDLLPGERIIDVTLRVDAPFSTALLQAFNYEGSPPGMIYRADLRGEAKVEDSKELSPEDFDALVQLIEKNRFTSFDEVYENSELTDGTWYTLEVKYAPTGAEAYLADAWVHSVSCYWTCPEPVVEIRTKIKELWGREILIEGV